MTLATRILVAALVLGPAACAGCGARPSPPLASSATPRASAVRPPGPSPLAPVYAKGLEGDMREGLRLLRAVPVDALDEKERTQRRCLLRTFDEKTMPPIAVEDPFVARVIGVYREYWLRALLHEVDLPAGERYLSAELAALLGPAGATGKDDSFDALMDRLGGALREHGYFSSRGQVWPYRELMIWAKETTSTYDVGLPEGSISVKVVFMRDFVVLGWSALATCGKAFTGGWAKEDSLYCVADSYDLASEKFAVSFLAHEAQHFADYKRFPKLEPPELEYRAKLVELAQAKTTVHALVSRFAGQRGDSRASPHNYANGRVIADLSRAVFATDAPVTDEARWTAVPVPDLNGAADAVLRKHTERLTALGAATVTEALP